jgi:hypothetical protein
VGQKLGQAIGHDVVLLSSFVGDDGFQRTTNPNLVTL